MTLPPADLDALEKQSAQYLAADVIDRALIRADPRVYAALPDLLRMARRCVEMERESGEAKRQYAWHLETRDQTIREYAMQVANLKAALRQAIDLISIPAAEHGREERDAAAGITGGPRYSAGLRRLHAECAALLPVLKAALIGMRLEPEDDRSGEGAG